MILASLYLDVKFWIYLLHKSSYIIKKQIAAKSNADPCTAVGKTHDHDPAEAIKPGARKD